MSLNGRNVLNLVYDDILREITERYGNASGMVLCTNRSTDESTLAGQPLKLHFELVSQMSTSVWLITK